MTVLSLAPKRFLPQPCQEYGCWMSVDSVSDNFDTSAAYLVHYDGQNTQPPTRFLITNEMLDDVHRDLWAEFLPDIEALHAPEEEPH